eukprot:m.188232 g.188232  ORF g.188232 m.188232 type:complete len:544 (+) comp15615_c0_seq2:123-1754(+)
MTQLNWSRIVSLLFIIPSVFSVLAESEDDWKTESNLWYSLRIGGATAGVLQTAMAVNKKTGHYRSSENMNLTIQRGEDKVRLSFVTEMEEDSKGHVLSAGYTQTMAQDTVEMSYTFTDDKVKVRSVQAGTVRNSDAPAVSKDHLGKAAIKRKVLAAVQEDTDTITYGTIKPELGADIVNVQSTRLGQAMVDTGAGGVQTYTWETVVVGMPLKVKEWIDINGDVLKMHIDAGTGLIEAEISTQEQAINKAKNEKASPELVDSTNVILSAPNPKLHSWSGAKRARYVVHSKSGDNDSLDLPAQGYQQVKRRSDGGVYVVVDLQTASPASDEDKNDREHIEPSAMVDSADPLVRGIAEKALQESGQHTSLNTAAETEALDSREVYQRAQILRQGVQRHIKKFDLATGYASASETARRASGDCSEHAVLLAALLRADGIPSRVCSGLVYTERQVPNTEGHCDKDDLGCQKNQAMYTVRGSFAWHAWTQAIIGGKWVDLDATLHHTPYSVGHVLMGTSKLSDRTGHADEMKLVSMVGNLKINVEDITM